MSRNINAFPQCGTLTISTSTTYAGANLVTFAVPAYYLSLTETAGHPVTVQLNGASTARFPLPASSTISIPVNAATIGSIDFANSSGSTASVVYIAGLSGN